MQHNDTFAGKILVLISALGTYLSITSIQPLFTLVASCVSIVAGLFAIRYYIKKSK
jgi:hypothetical protein